MANTYTLISSVTVGAGGASSIDFTSIPSTYTDLLIKVSTRTTRTGTDHDDELRISFNGNTTGYSTKMIEGGTSVRSTSDSGSYIGRGVTDTDDATANTFGNTEYYIPNYAGSNYKSLSFDTVQEDNQAYALKLLVAGLWTNTSAITSISITAIGTFNQYSTAYLYGIKNS